jgi:chaperone BCS1
MKLSFVKDEGKTITYRNSGDDWRRSGARYKRPLDSVILDDSVKESVIADINEFMNSSSWYRNLGIPYRRGYLFYGFPGTGKTSFIFALAGYFSFNICIVNLNDKDLSDDTLISLLNNTPKRCILIIEDIDVAFKSRENNNNNNNYITLSGLLNAIDGIAAQEGRILFMTTNNFNILDEALIRPGRIDFTLSFTNANKYQIKNMFKRFYQNCSDEEINEFIEIIGNNLITMAQLQGFLLKFKNNSKQSIKELSIFIKTINNTRKSISSH